MNSEGWKDKYITIASEELEISVERWLTVHSKITQALEIFKILYRRQAPGQ